MIRQTAALVVALCLSTSSLYAQNTTMTVSATTANVHKAPSLGSPVIGQAPKGAALTVTRSVGDWVKVSWPKADDGVGYVRANAIVASNAVAAPAAAQVAAKPAAPVAGAKPKAVTSAAAAKAKPAVAGSKGTTTTAAAVAPAAPAVSLVPATPISAQTAVIPVAKPSAPSAARTLYVAPTHTLGMGMVAGGSTMGYGASARTWRKNRIGLQLEVSRHTFDSVDLLSRATSTDIAPSVLVALNDHVTDYMWLRPYVGLAAHYGHASRTDLIFLDQTETANTMGARVFLGSEMAFSSVPQFALSADVGYYKLPEPFVGFEPGGLGFSVSAHWYMK